MNTYLRTMLACLLAATIFWVLNALNKDGYSTKIAYPLQIEYNDSLFIPTSPLPNKVKVTVTSSGWNLLRDNLSAGIKPIIYEVENPMNIQTLSVSALRAALVSSLPNSQISDIQLDNQQVSFDRKIVKTIALKVDSSAVNLRKNYVISSPINLSPTRLTLIGPESILRNYQDTMLIPLSTKELANNFDEKVTIEMPKHPFVSASIEKVMVSFEVAELLQPISKK